jgi:MFS transporter, FSR family, fosmidomycin resistance protein
MMTSYPRYYWRNPVPAANTSAVEIPIDPAVQPLDDRVTGDRFHTEGVTIISAAHFVHDTYTAFISPLLPVLIANLSLTKTAAGMLVVFAQGPSLLQPVIGHLGDRFNLRILVIIAPAITAAMLSLLGIAPTYAVLALLMLVAGLSSAGLHAVGPVMAGQLSGGKLGRAMSFWMVGGEMGRTLGPVVLVAGVSLLTPRGLPWLMIAGVAASVALYFRLRSIPLAKPAGANGLAVSQALAKLKPIMFPLVAVITARSLLFSSLNTFLPTFMTEEGSSLWMAGASYSIMEAAGVAGVLAGGLVSDRIGRRRVMITMSFIAPLVMLVFLGVSGWLRFPALILIGLTFLSTTPVLMAIVQEQADGTRALANGIYMMLNFVITSVAVLIVGLLADRFGLRTALYTSAYLMLAGLPFVFMLPRDVTKKKKIS